MWLPFHRISEWLWHQGTSCGLLNVNADARWTQLPADTHCPGSDPHPATCSLQTVLPKGAHDSPETFTRVLVPRAGNRHTSSPPLVF